MILVTVGTHLPFARLTREAARLAADTGERVIVQGGGRVAGTADAVEHVDLLEFDDLVRLVADARVVVTHAGVGSILTCLRNGRKPVVVPRRATFGEAADDHQVPFARRLALAGLVTLVEDPRELAAAAAVVDTHTMPASASSALVRDLSVYLRASVGR